MINIYYKLNKLNFICLLKLIILKFSIIYDILSKNKVLFIILFIKSIEFSTTIEVYFKDRLEPFFLQKFKELCLSYILVYDLWVEETG